jgi:hypothetical protein
MVKENYAKIGDLGCFKYFDPEEVERKMKEASAGAAESRPSTTGNKQSKEPSTADDMLF